MKINPKIKINKNTEDVESPSGEKEVIPGFKVDDKVFQWNPEKLSFHSPTGEVFFCQIIQNGPDISGNEQSVDDNEIV